MRSTRSAFLTICFLLAPRAALAAPSSINPPALAARIEERLAGRRAPFLSAHGEAILSFYSHRGFAPVWLNEVGFLPQAFALFDVIGQAGAAGLDPADYQLRELTRPLAAAGAPPVPEAFADLDLRLTAAFWGLATDLANGRTAKPGHDNRLTGQPPVDPGALLAAALQGGRVREALLALEPQHPSYVRLKQAAARYRGWAAAGGWPELPAALAAARPGERSPAIPLLRARLAAEGDLPATPPAAGAALDPELFDPALVQALKSFNDRHGLQSGKKAAPRPPKAGERPSLPPDAVGAEALAALNVPAEARQRQLEANLERWRWLPRSLGERYVLVNIPDYRLEMVADGKTVLAMRAIVGKPARSTPSLSTEATSVVVHPTWNIPQKILDQEILPKALADPGYLARHGYEIVQKEGRKPRVRQRPGPGNALGKLKVHLRDTPEIYLHDTPSHGLFARDRRALSHGCVRLEKPLELAALLLGGDEARSHQRIADALTQVDERWLALPRPVPVHLVYFTAWADDAGGVQFRPDLYGRDQPLLAALERPAKPAGERLATGGGKGEAAREERERPAAGASAAGLRPD